MKKKKAIIAIALIAVVGLVGGAIAYFTSSTLIENVFKTATYETKVSEEFVSPEGWLPGTTTEKKVYAENSGDVDVAVRVSYTEKWTSANGAELPLKQNGENVAIINFANSTDWTYSSCDGYYYYNDTLTKGNKTSSFIDSVTFNEKTEMNIACSTVGTTTTCKSTGDGYDGATYELAINIETIQADAKGKAWVCEYEQ